MAGGVNRPGPRARTCETSGMGVYQALACCPPSRRRSSGCRDLIPVRATLPPALLTAHPTFLAGAPEPPCRHGPAAEKARRRRDETTALARGAQLDLPGVACRC